MDGWRLDVVHMLGEDGGARNNIQHVAGITQSAKAANPDAFVFGEHFGDARQWLQADAEDSAMTIAALRSRYGDFPPTMVARR